MDSSSSESEGEWGEEIEFEELQEEKDILPILCSGAGSALGDNKKIEIAIPNKSSKRKKQNFYEKAVTAYEKEEQISIHKVHLLCLLSNGIYSSRQCDLCLVQSLVLSMAPSTFVFADSGEIVSETILPRLLRWFSSKVDVLLKVVEEHSDLLPDVCCYSEVQLLVSLLRALGARTRLVLAFKVSPLKPPKSPPKKLKSKAIPASPERCPKMTRRTSKEEILKEFGYVSPSKSSVGKAASPYFKKRRHNEDITSPVTSSEILLSDQDDSDKELIPKKKRKKASPTPSDSSIAESNVTQDKNDSSSSQLYDSANSWAEVLVKGKWACLHLPSLSVGQPSFCEKQCPYSMNYVIGFENDRTIVDVTARYASQWCSKTIKNRVDEKWWADTLRPYAPPINERENEEEDITGILLSHPLPTSMSDYKGHPLYVLKRHLLKFEALYPEESEILGYFKGEPVYSRSCVHMLHTRETWLKEGRLVRRGEKPYKTVKGRKRKGQTSLEAEANTAEVFGKWQTEEYIPPPVIDGKVSKNEYGNIELFQPSMLPAGAVHIKVSGIAKVARKLSIDYAPAMMGWDHHGGSCYPIIEGIVVAEEFRDVLMEAWSQEQQISIEKDIKKREKRAVAHWVKLMKGLLIRERVKKRFAVSDHFSSEGSST